ncbi:hypothetical protein SMD44_03600 [Streptomyces alboflavus]|uniref:Uncharacterized protein n=1 Tax=Streptomyces alboflavus TaxID=67267 RepID=A0A1Z1WCI4_9ACTN|nr:hypothetical protein SMD44_03600 [Streptomyces alboflavus]
MVAVVAASIAVTMIPSDAAGRRVEATVDAALCR